MKKIAWAIAGLCIVVAVCSKSARTQSYTETHYVCSAGNGAGATDGTSWANCFDGFADIAWDGETEDADDNEVGPNDKLELRDDDGVYREQLDVSASGLSGKPITIGVESGDSPIVSGAALVTTWEDGVGNIWQATFSPEITTTTQLVTFDRAVGTEESALADLDAALEWYYCDGCADGIDNTLYVYSTSDPDTAYTSPGIEATSRHRALRIDSQQYVTVDGIAFYHGHGQAARIFTVSNILFDNCEFSYGYEYGLLAANATVESDITVSSSEVAYNGGTGIAVYGASDTGWLMQSNDIHDNSYLNDTAEHTYSAGIKIGAGAVATIEENLVYENAVGVGGTVRGFGIWVDIGGSGSVVRYNRSYSNNVDGIFIEKTDDTDVYYNISYSNRDGIRVSAEDSGYKVDGNEVYNNACYGNSRNGLAAQGINALADSFTNNIFKNNISSGNTTREFAAFYGGENDGTMGSGNVYTYNCFGAEAANFIEWGAASYHSTYDTWQAAGGCGVDICDNQVEADPQFTGATDFTLQITSPAIDAGVDLGTSYDDALDPASTWPSSVTTLDQDDWGLGWEIGAYVRKYTVHLIIAK